MHAAHNPVQNVQWHKTGDLYWLGYVLMRLLHVLSQAEPDGAIVAHGLAQAHHHAGQLGLDEAITGRLLALKAQAEATDEWSTLNRNAIVLDVGAIVERVGDLAESNQPGYVGRASADR